MGASIGTALFNFAVDIAGILAGLLALVLVCMGVVILAHVGNDHFRKNIRSHLFDVFLGTLFVGGFRVLAPRIAQLATVGTVIHSLNLPGFWS